VRNPEQIEKRIGELNRQIQVLCAPREPQAGRAQKLFELQGEIRGLEFALGVEVANAA